MYFITLKASTNKAFIKNTYKYVVFLRIIILKIFSIIANEDL